MYYLVVQAWVPDFKPQLYIPPEGNVARLLQLYLTKSYLKSVCVLCKSGGDRFSRTVLLFWSSSGKSSWKPPETTSVGLVYLICDLHKPVLMRVPSVITGLIISRCERGDESQRVFNTAFTLEVGVLN